MIRSCWFIYYPLKEIWEREGEEENGTGDVGHQRGEGSCTECCLLIIWLSNRASVAAGPGRGQLSVRSKGVEAILLPSPSGRML